MKMPLDFIQELMMEAFVYVFHALLQYLDICVRFWVLILLVFPLRLQIEKEKLFVDLSGVIAAVRCWEERATKLLAQEAQMLDFEDIIRF